jgi:hypothetical protein
MIRRGRRIAILESSARGKSHPRKGDVGYLNNAFLFFKDRFILIDAFFFKYASDKCSRNPERKRFIVDVGMRESLKMKFRNLQVKKRDMSPHSSTNLTPVEYNGVYMPDIYQSQVFGKSTSPKALKAPLRAPYGKISFCSGPFDLSNADTNEIRAWFYSITPIITTSINNVVNRGLPPASVLRLDSWVIDQDGPIISVNGRLDIAVGYTAPLIKTVKMVEAINGVFMNAIDTDQISKIKPSARAVAGEILKRYGDFETALANGVLKRREYATIVSIFYRSLLTECDTEKKLSMLGIFLNSKAQSKRMAQICRNVRKEATMNSAALNRVFEEPALVIHKL